MKAKWIDNKISFVGTVAQFKDFLKEVEYQATAPRFGHNYEEWDEYE
jgi:hypothetical protein